MIQLIRSGDRYHVENEWLSAYWHFSFADYHDPANVSFGPLRVFNNDTIAPGGGFPFHPHREMEIVTYLIQGSSSTATPWAIPASLRRAKSSA